jgi:hypothetical protein
MREGALQANGVGITPHPAGVQGFVNQAGAAAGSTPPSDGPSLGREVGVTLGGRGSRPAMMSLT